MKMKGLRSRIIKEDDDIYEVVKESLEKNEVKLKDMDILVIASKVLALTQKKILKVKSADYKKGDLKDIIEEEGGKLFETNYCWLTYKDNHLIPNAGIDKSNMPRGKIVLWPDHPYKAAKNIQKKLKEEYKIKKLGVIISDSTCSPLRTGVHGISIGYFGFDGLEDLRGEKDIYNNKMEVTRRALADCLASAALIVMGEADEQKPLAVISDAPVNFTEKDPDIKAMPIDDDLFYGIYNSAFKEFIINNK
jgi:coenzyme F420-0:L-glutamate ligase